MIKHIVEQTEKKRSYAENERLLIPGGIT